MSPMKTRQDFFDCITWVYDGYSGIYAVNLDGEEVYRTKDARDRDLFIAQLKTLVIWNDMCRGFPRMMEMALAKSEDGL